MKDVLGFMTRCTPVVDYQYVSAREESCMYYVIQGTI